MITEATIARENGNEIILKLSEYEANTVMNIVSSLTKEQIKENEYDTFLSLYLTLGEILEGI